jgi:hypothetical protein
MQYTTYIRRIQTLDALPATNNTPFNGIPPANLLDKIARGVTGAKKEDWPHTVRQTRMKLLELSRVRAKEVVFEDRLSAIIHEEVHEDGGSDIENDFARATTPARTPGKKPLHRQSSMDFMSSAKLGNKAIDSFGRFVFSSLVVLCRCTHYAADSHAYNTDPRRRRPIVVNRACSIHARRAAARSTRAASATPTPLATPVSAASATMLSTAVVTTTTTATATSTTAPHPDRPSNPSLPAEPPP